MNKNDRDFVHREVEIKLELTASVYEQIKSTFPGMKTGKYQENFFFDTSDSFLLNNKWFLRVRTVKAEHSSVKAEHSSVKAEHSSVKAEHSSVKAEQGYITVKGPGKIIDALHSRIEYESTISGEKALSLLEGFHLQSQDYLPCRELIKRFGDMFVIPFLSFKNTRFSCDWKDWKFELDKTTIQDRVFYELEVETDPVKKDILEQELKKLFAEYGWVYIPNPVNKFNRAFSITRKNAPGE